MSRATLALRQAQGEGQFSILILSLSKDGWHVIPDEVVLRAVPNNWLPVRWNKRRSDVQLVRTRIDVTQISAWKLYPKNEKGRRIDAILHWHAESGLQDCEQMLFGSRAHFLVPNWAVARDSNICSLCKGCQNE